MQKTIMICLFSLLWAMPCFARDYIVEFEDENYKEEQQSFSYSPIIYHSIQVRTSAGPKLLVLTGDHYNYRKWLRQYIAQGKAFIAKVHEEQVDQFITSSAFDIDVTRLHPLDLEQYNKAEEKTRHLKNPSAMAADQNERMRAIAAANRSRLIDTQSQSNQKGTDSDRITKNARESVLKEKAEQQKARANDQDKKAREDREKEQTIILEKQAQKKQVENEQILKELAEQKNLEEKRAKEQEALFAQLADQRARDEQSRKQELESRWQELKQRLLQDERIRNLEIDARNREIQNRWLELRYNLDL
ncbi:MAG: hypothetical protein ABIJ31_09455 [Pseudomonadota bacterium]